MFDAHNNLRLYREEMARLERDLERRRHLPERKRRSLPGIRFLGFRHGPVAPRGGC